MDIFDNELNLDFDINLEKEPKRIDDTVQKQAGITNTLDFSFDIPEDKIEISKNKQVSIGISSILAESERLSFNEFFKNFDKKELPAIINGELTLYTNDLNELSHGLLSNKTLNQHEYEIIFSKPTPLGTLDKTDIESINFNNKEFIEYLENYTIKSPQEVDNLKSLLLIRNSNHQNEKDFLNKIESFENLIEEIKETVIYTTSLF